MVRGVSKLLRNPTVSWAGFTSVTNGAGTLWVFGIMLLICTDVVSRAVFQYPIRGVAELVGYSITAAVYLQLAHTLHAGRFTRAELFIDGLAGRRPIAGQLFFALFNLLGAVILGLIAHGGFLKFLEVYPDLKFGNEGQNEFSILIWPLRAIITFGATLAAVEFFRQFLGNLSAMARGVKARLKEAPADRKPIGWGAIALLAGVLLLFAWVATNDLTRMQVGAVSLVGILILICLGVHIGIAMITLGLISSWMMFGNPNIGLNIIKLASNEFLRVYFFGVVPLFVLMGLLVSESDIGKDTFDVARWVLRPIKGGLGIATVAANAVFASITGSSIASAAVFTKVAAPQMMDQGYTARFSVGTVAGSSVLGMLIPPSLLLIIYGFVVEESVGVLFMAAIVPGIILAVAMGISIIAMATLWPAYVGTPTHDDLAQETIVSAFWKLLPIMVLVGFILGGIYGGFFTPVEAGAVGALGALVIATLKRRLTYKKLWKVMVETGHISVSILFLIMAANIFARMLALSGLPQQMGTLIGALDLGFYGFMALYVVLVIVLGMFLDSVSIILIVVPLVLPIVKNFGGDLIWFGIITVIAVEMGLLTPPMGISCYVVKSTLDDDRVTLVDIFAGAFPYVVIMLLVTILLVIFPQLSLFFT